jgi:hypothetical protein
MGIPPADNGVEEVLDDVTVTSFESWMIARNMPRYAIVPA